MDGIHDLGGMQGFGPVEVERDEPVFHHGWEGRTFALTAAALGRVGINTPMFRHAIERMDPAHYLASSYYEHWLTAVATLLVEEGLLARDDLEARAGSFPLSRPGAGVVEEVGTQPRSESAVSPAFEVGDRVRVRNLHFGGHTRCPGYVRGRRGVVVRVDAAAPVPEIEAHRREKVMECTCSVRFAVTDLWGDSASDDAVVHVDLYERYLEPA